jgi:hypothetical protein
VELGVHQRTAHRQGPLAKVDGNYVILLEDCAPQLDAPASYLGFVCEGARQMGHENSKQELCRRPTPLVEMEHAKTIWMFRSSSRFGRISKMNAQTPDRRYRIAITKEKLKADVSESLDW